MNQPTDPSDPPQVVELAEETARVDVRETVTGRVRVSTRTEAFDEVRTQELHATQTDVQRVPVGRTLEPGEALPVIRTEGDTTIIPVFEEIAVVETRLVLKEELHVTQRKTAETVDIPLTLRRQTASVERLEPDE